MPIEIVNIKTTGWPRTSDGIYVGRRRDGTHYGNPWSHLAVHNTLKCDTREDSITAFREWLTGASHKAVEPARRTWILSELLRGALQNKKLYCWCYPAACHAQVLRDLQYKYSQSSVNRSPQGSTS